MSNIPNGFLPVSPFLYKTIDEDILEGKELFVEVHPATASALGLGEGERAVVKTPLGEAPVRVRLFTGAREGMLFLARGFGHAAYGEYVEGKGVNANNVMEVLTDPVTGQGSVWASRALLQRA
jgi:anaerobic selenocysteine-containing dehydrogenase